MKKYYCNGKKGFCDRYNGEAEPNCMGCIHGDGTGGEVIENITNYDRIRNMSVEELAKFIPDWSYTKACKCNEIYVDCNNECWKCVKEWLESEVQGE